MSSTDQAPEPTMDEILASIRRIIADEPAGDQPGSSPAVAQVRDTNVAKDIASALEDSGSGAPEEEEDIFDLSQEYVADPPAATVPPVQAKAPVMPPPDDVPPAPPVQAESFDRPLMGSQSDPEARLAAPYAPIGPEQEGAPVPPGMMEPEKNAPEPPISGSENRTQPQFRSPPPGAVPQPPAPPGPSADDLSKHYGSGTPEFRSAQERPMQPPQPPGPERSERRDPAQQTGFIPPMRDSGFLVGSGQPDVTFATIDNDEARGEFSAAPEDFERQFAPETEGRAGPQEDEPEARDDDFGRRDPSADMGDSGSQFSELRDDQVSTGESRFEMEDVQEATAEDQDSLEDQPVIQLGSSVEDILPHPESEEAVESSLDVAAGMSAAVAEEDRFVEADDPNEGQSDQHFIPSQNEEIGEATEGSDEEFSAVGVQDYEASAQPDSAEVKSLEQSVKELLRPMLRDWLDNNMPKIIEGVVKEEMKVSKDQ